MAIFVVLNFPNEHGCYHTLSFCIDTISRQLVETSPTPLSEAESLEQLRWLENGHKIHVAITEGNSIGVDTPHDILIVEKLLK